MAANWSAGRAAEFVNIGRNVLVASKSGPVETGPTVPVATALNCDCETKQWLILGMITDLPNCLLD